MGVRKVTFAINEYYHLYNRGNSKQVIFKSPKDYQRFLRLLYIANSDLPFKIEYLERQYDLDQKVIIP